MNITNLRRKVLEKLQVVAAGESPHASDGNVVQDAYERLHELLMEENLVSWVISEEIPESHAQTIIAMVAAEVCDEFYCPDGLKQKIFSEGKFDLPLPSIAERRLRKLAAQPYSSEPAQPDYF